MAEVVEVLHMCRYSWSLAQVYGQRWFLVKTPLMCPQSTVVGTLGLPRVGISQLFYFETSMYNF